MSTERALVSYQKERQRHSWGAAPLTCGYWTAPHSHSQHSPALLRHPPPAPLYCLLLCWTADPLWKQTPMESGWLYPKGSPGQPKHETQGYSSFHIPGCKSGCPLPLKCCVHHALSMTKWQISTCTSGPQREKEPSYCVLTLYMQVPSCAGDMLTITPALWRAEIFSLAPPFPPAIIAPAWPILLPGGAVIPAMKDTTGLAFGPWRGGGGGCKCLESKSNLWLLASSKWLGKGKLNHHSTQTLSIPLRETQAPHRHRSPSYQPGGTPWTVTHTLTQTFLLINKNHTLLFTWKLCFMTCDNNLRSISLLYFTSWVVIIILILHKCPQRKRPGVMGHRERLKTCTQFPTKAASPWTTHITDTDLDFLKFEVWAIVTNSLYFKILH